MAMLDNIIFALLFWALAVFMINRRRELATDKWPVGWVEALLIALAAGAVTMPLLASAGSPAMKILIVFVAGLSIAALTAVALMFLRR